jgi:hypothetical protein
MASSKKTSGVSVSKKVSQAQKKGILVGAGIAALAFAGIAGSYFLYGKDGAKNRKKITSWMLQAKADILKKIEKLQNITRDQYEAIVEKAIEQYKKAESISEKDVDAFAKKMKKYWKDIEKDLTK